MSKDEIRLAVKAAFADARKAGYLARMNFSCCGSCGHYELGEKSDRYIFYHHQEQDAVFGSRHGRRAFKTNITPDRPLHLQWKGNGLELRDILTAHGLIVSWNGAAGQTLMVTGGMTAAEKEVA